MAGHGWARPWPIGASGIKEGVGLGLRVAGSSNTAPQGIVSSRVGLALGWKGKLGQEPPRAGGGRALAASLRRSDASEQILRRGGLQQNHFAEVMLPERWWGGAGPRSITSPK